MIISVAQAQDITTPGGTGSQPTGSGEAVITNPLKFSDTISLLREVLDIFLQFAVVIAAFFIIYAGFLYVTARGNEGKVKKATEIFTNTIIGTIIILGAYVILEIIQNTVNTFTR